ncbi:hypothetical protein MTYP_00765 [Methylophilaceae bacterium]|nr:hypothetical protein MTYP_00765 [Methylophilaceae bacterium]
MRSTMLAMLLVFSAIFPRLLHAADEFTATDYSGVYDCKGVDGHEGEYAGTVTLSIRPAYSSGNYASYDFKLEVPEYGAYLGHAAGNGNHLAMHFALTDPASRDFGTGIAKFRTDAQGRQTFHKFYFQPEYKGGNSGIEDCVKR